MDRISDSGSDDMGSNPVGVTIIKYIHIHIYSSTHYIYKQYKPLTL